MQDWDIQIVGSKKSNVTFEELERIAKKGGYHVVRKGETDNIRGIDAIKSKVGHPRKNLSKDSIIELRKRGYTMKEIAKALGVARATVYLYLGKDYPKKQ